MVIEFVGDGNLRGGGREEEQVTYGSKGMLGLLDGESYL